MTNIKIVESVSLKDTLNINSIFLTCLIDIKIIEDRKFEDIFQYIVF